MARKFLCCFCLCCCLTSTWAGAADVILQRLHGTGLFQQCPSTVTFEPPPCLHSKPSSAFARLQCSAPAAYYFSAKNGLAAQEFYQILRLICHE